MWRILLACALAATAAAQVRPIAVDAARRTGEIRSLQGVNDGPAPLVPLLADASAAYRDLRIDLVRTHDYFGPADIDAKWPAPDPIARAVKADGARSIFPDWSADPERESSYNFAPSDRVIQAIINCGAEVYFRIGRSWSADPAPPPDFDKYAAIVRHVAMHYNGGWANGFHDHIRYWEVWNEPDVEKAWAPNFVREFWTGTPRQFYEIYDKVARGLKALDPALQVGGPAKARGEAAGPYREGFLDYAAAHRVPLDFYSWHHYAHRSGDPYDYPRIAREIRALLDARGLTRAATILSEWGFGAAVNPQQQATMETAAFVSSALIYMQDAPLERALYYRGDSGTMGLLDARGAYRRKAYTFRAVGAMQETPLRLAVTGGDERGFAVLAGVSRDARTVQVLISNYEIPERMRHGIRYENNRGYRLRVANLPWGKGGFQVKRYRISESENAAESESGGEGGSLDLSGQLPAPGVERIVVRALP